MNAYRGLQSLKLATVDTPALGCFLFSRDPAITDIAGFAGLDFVIADMEHAGLSLGQIESHVRAAQRTGLAVLVRMPDKDPSLASRLLDQGVHGLVIPHFGVDVERDRRLLEGLRFAPEGTRPACSGVTAVNYGLTPFAEATRTANDSVFVIAQLEDAGVVSISDELSNISGLDAIMPGPGDLAASFGVPGRFDDERVTKAITTIEASARKAGRKIARYLVEPSAPQGTGESAQILVCSIDYRILGRALEDIRFKVLDERRQTSS